VRAQQQAAAARPYARQITAVIEDLAAAGASVEHPLLRPVTDPKRIAYVVLTSDRGLAGAYNSSVIRLAEREVMADRTEGRASDLILIGRKSEGYFRFRNYPIEQTYQGISDKPRYEDARRIAEYVTERFVTGAVDRVVLVYTEFISLGSQRPVVRNFLPLQAGATIAEHGSAQAIAGFDFEPSPEGVLEALLPRYVEARLYAALLESAASEHASRQRAMKAATDNAEEMIVRLSRQLNRARQDAITTEIMEIIGGAEGLKEDKGSEEDLLLDRLEPLHAFPRREGTHGHRPPANV
jgi:F-type H+-transporting ATPase subunit gamma